MSKAKKAEGEQGVARIALVTPPTGGRPVPMVTGTRGSLLLPAPTRPRRVSLPNSPKRALAEISRVYAEARRGQLHVDDASKLSYVLKNAGDLHRDHVLDAKVDALKVAVENIAKILAERGHTL